MKHYIVTGGAGFVGSHLVAALLGRGDAVTVIDDLSTGHAEAVLPGAELVVGDIADRGILDSVLSAGPCDAVFHFAAKSLVGESMREPMLYFEKNSGAAVTLIDACVRHGVRRFVLSSTAALFGTPARLPIPDDAPVAPLSPYGESKFFIERTLKWADKVHGLRSCALRYFNAAGSDPAGRLGEDHEPETHLIPLVIDAALGRRPELSVMGTDYFTPDGTCIRDYVHVTDLAQAHLLALEAMEGGSTAFNVGNGNGASVLEIIRAVERVSGLRVPFRTAARRPGDPAALIADSSRLRAVGWNPAYANLDMIVGTAFAWRAAHPSGFRKPPKDRIAA